MFDFIKRWFRRESKSVLPEATTESLHEDEVVKLVNVINDAIKSDNIANGIEATNEIDPLLALAMYRAFETGNVVVANRDKNGNCTIKELPND